MAMTVNTNVPSINAQRNLLKTQNAMAVSLKRLSSGLRINSAKDDAAGLGIGNRMGAQIRGLNQAVRNANDGISVAQTAEGALQETTSLLQRMRELAVAAANDSNTSDDRESIQIEVDQLVKELDRIATNTTFNNKKILDGTSSTFNFQVGANSNQTISVDLVNVKANALGEQAGIVQSTGYRVTLTDDTLDAGTQGIQEVSTGALTSVGGGDIAIKIGNNSAVSIATTTFGGTITSVALTAATDVTSSQYGTGIAKMIADRINNIREMEMENTKAGESGTYLEGVYASATTTFKVSDLKSDETDLKSTASGSSAGSNYTYVGSGSITNGGLKINGVDIGPATFDKEDESGTLTTAINAKSDQTGVQASINTDGELVLTASDGRDIIVTTSNTATTNLLFAAGGSIANTSQATTEDFSQALTNLRITGNVTISSRDTISLTASLEGGEAGFNNDTPASGSLKETNVQAKGSIAYADVTSADSANDLIDSVDSALKQVDNMRAKLGAVQNRLDSTISNLMNVSENLSASQSRVMDADFAAETASMTKNQILQQAGVAMLAQSNQLPQAALSLLQ